MVRPQRKNPKNTAVTTTYPRQQQIMEHTTPQPPPHPMPPFPPGMYANGGAMTPSTPAAHFGYWMGGPSPQSSFRDNKVSPLIARVKLGHSLQAPESNSTTVTRKTVLKDSNITVAEWTKNVIRDNLEWVAKLARRQDPAETMVVLAFGDGWETLVLLDNKKKVTGLKNAIPRVGVAISLPEKQESLEHETEDALADYGILHPSDLLWEHMSSAASSGHTVPNLYLHSKTTIWTEGNPDCRSVIRLATDAPSDPYDIVNVAPVSAEEEKEIMTSWPISVPITQPSKEKKEKKKPATSRPSRSNGSVPKRKTPTPTESPTEELETATEQSLPEQPQTNNNEAETAPAPPPVTATVAEQPPVEKLKANKEAATKTATPKKPSTRKPPAAKTTPAEKPKTRASTTKKTTRAAAVVPTTKPSAEESPTTTKPSSAGSPSGTANNDGRPMRARTRSLSTTSEASESSRKSPPKRAAAAVAAAKVTTPSKKVAKKSTAPSSTTKKSVASDTAASNPPNFIDNRIINLNPRELKILGHAYDSRLTRTDLRADCTKYTVTDAKAAAAYADRLSQELEDEDIHMDEGDDIDSDDGNSANGGKKDNNEETPPPSPAKTSKKVEKVTSTKKPKAQSTATKKKPTTPKPKPKKAAVDAILGDPISDDDEPISMFLLSRKPKKTKLTVTNVDKKSDNNDKSAKKSAKKSGKRSKPSTSSSPSASPVKKKSRKSQ